MRVSCRRDRCLREFSGVVNIVGLVGLLAVVTLPRRRSSREK